MRNNVACKIIRIETIGIKIDVRVIWALINIKYVSGIKKYLLSLDIIYALECTFRAKGGILNVIKSLVVIVKGKK